jgi:hypothetical protein
LEARVLTNHSSLKLNERGPALNVFWSRWRGIGATKGRLLIKRLPVLSARTRWVTERIAHQADPKSEKEKTGSSQSLQNAFGLEEPEEKSGTVTFYLLTNRLNG